MTRSGSKTNLKSAIADLRIALATVEKTDVKLAAAYTELAIFFCEEALMKTQHI